MKCGSQLLSENGLRSRNHALSTSHSDVFFPQITQKRTGSILQRIKSFDLPAGINAKSGWRHSLGTATRGRLRPEQPGRPWMRCRRSCILVRNPLMRTTRTSPSRFSRASRKAAMSRAGKWPLVSITNPILDVARSLATGPAIGSAPISRGDQGCDGGISLLGSGAR